MPPEPQTPPAQTPPTPTPTPPAGRSRVGGSKSSMLKLVIVAVIVIFVALLIAYALNRPASKTNKTTAKKTAQIQKAAVNITKTGFEPATIQVAVHTQITWTNMDSAVHQVAADPYPKDDSIPNFNSSVILQTKNTTSFIFDKAGTYTYHDERNPLQFKGTVVVQ